MRGRSECKRCFLYLQNKSGTCSTFTEGEMRNVYYLNANARESRRASNGINKYITNYTRVNAGEHVFIYSYGSLGFSRPLMKEIAERCANVTRSP